VGKLQALTPLVKGLQDTTANLSVRVGRIEETLVKHTQQLEQLSGLPGVVVNVQNSVGELASRTSSLEGNFARLNDIVAQLQDMVSKLSGRLDAAEARDEDMAKKFSQLTDGFSKLLIDVESLKIKINELQDRIAKLGAPQPVEIPDVKALVQQAVAEKTKELQAQLAQAKKEAQDAKAAVEGANSLALIALVAGLAGVLIGFLF
jgi:chromosome segregation ATPase